MPKAGSLVAAIDLGTSRTAFAYGVVGRTDIRVGIPDSKADPDSPVEEKTATAVVLAPNGGDRATVEGWDVKGFGGRAEVEFLKMSENEDPEVDGRILFKFFKMDMYQGRPNIEEHEGEPEHTALTIDTPTSTATDGTVLPTILVVSKALEYIKGEVLAFINRASDGGDFTVEDVTWVLTVPAIWSDFSKGFMRVAAKRAGIISNEGSEGLRLCLEPEAACLSVGRFGDEQGNNRNDENASPPKIIVLDCGGGTVDITSHMWESVEPMKLVELDAPCGGHWGSTQIDEAFKSLLQDLFDDMWQEDVLDKASFHTVMLRWEHQKTQYSRGSKGAWVAIYEVMELLELERTDMVPLLKEYNTTREPAEHLKMQNSQLIIPPRVVEAFFSPSIRNILGEVTRLLMLPTLDGVKYIYMVGGFSSSPLLQEEIRREFDQPEASGDRCTEGHRVFIDDRPGIAIVRGAVKFGLQDDGFIRKARLTYGMKTNVLYNKNNPEHQNRPATALSDGTRVLQMF